MDRGRDDTGKRNVRGGTVKGKNEGRVVKERKWKLRELIGVRKRTW